jgi:hypothetical protein
MIEIIVVLFVTLAAILAGFYGYGIAHLNEIKKNWVQYRCNPVYMPLAGAVGSDIMTNFTHCTMQSIQTYAGFVVDPIYNMFEDMIGVFAHITGSIQFIRQKIAGTTGGFLGIINSVFGKLQNTLGATSQLFGRIRTLMNRLMAIFVVMIHIVTTGVETGQSVMNGPVGKVAEFLCFDPDTPIVLKNKKQVPIIDVKVDDILEGDVKVTSVLMFEGTDTPMVSIGGTSVSGNHKILHNDKWIRCEEHPSAIKIASLPFLICLNTLTHTIPIAGMQFRDYEETDDVHSFYADVADHYKCSVPPLRYTFRETGFDIYTTQIRMENGSIRPLTAVGLGDRIAGGGRVIGIVVNKLNSAMVQVARGLAAAPGTILVLPTKLITAASPSYKAKHPEGDSRCINLLTENALVVAVDLDGNDITFLDDQEVADPRIHDKRDQKVLGH